MRTCEQGGIERAKSHFFDNRFLTTLLHGDHNPPGPSCGAEKMLFGIEPRSSGGWGRNRTGIDGFAGRCITTLPPSHAKDLKEDQKSRQYREGELGAGNEIRTRDPNLGKVVLYH